MSGVELFKLFATLSLDTSEFESGVKAAKREGESLFGFFDGAESKITKLSSALSVIKDVGSAISDGLRGAAEAGKELVEVSANLKAMDESMTSTFANLRPIAESFFKQVSELNNIEIGRLQQSGLGFFRQFAGAGMPDSIAITEMARALGLAADAAAASDISLEEASEMMRSFIRGNVEAGEAIGVFTSATSRDNEALEKYGKKWKELTEAQQQFLMLDKVETIYKRSGVLGQGAREMYNYTNVVGNLSRVWSEAQALMGDEIRDALIPALMDLTDWIKKNPDIFTNIGKVFGSIATSMVDAFQSLLALVDKHGDKIAGFFDALARLLDGDMSKAEFLFGEKPKHTITTADAIAAMRAYVNEEMNYHDLTNKIGKDAAGLFSADDIGIDDAALESKIAQALTLMQDKLDDNPVKATILPTWGGMGNLITTLGRVFFPSNSNAKGLDYVPYDDYVTRLHRGESVLNRVEAADWRASRRGESTKTTGDTITRAELLEAISHISLNVDSRAFASLVTPAISREQAAEAWRCR